MSDIFREVEEDLRKDQLQKLWNRFGPALVTGAVLIVAGTAGYTYWQNSQLSRMQENTAVLSTAIEAGIAEGADPAATATALGEAASRLTGSHATLARLYEAAALIRAGKRDEAIAIYDQVAGTGGVDPLLRDLALLMSVQHQVDTGDAAQLLARLEPLAAPGGPWQWSARELTGLLAARAGDTARAAALFTELSTDAAAPAGIRARAEELAALYAAAK
ncbi:MAG: hypothetical protein RLY86_2703 [Pseudomonadota bacterium]|jgi:hypothetical protein